MEGYLGTIQVFGGNFAPKNWTLCHGQLLSISQYPDLYKILGTIYGGDGKTTFALPDLKGRASIGAGTGTNLTPVILGQKGGSETATLTVSEIPAHNHTAAFQSSEASGTVNPSAFSGRASLSDDPTNNFPAKTQAGNEIYSDASDVEMGQSDVNVNVSDVQMEIEKTGGNNSFNIRNPFLGVNYIICINGIFPSQS